MHKNIHICSAAANKAAMDTAADEERPLLHQNLQPPPPASQVMMLSFCRRLERIPNCKSFAVLQLSTTDRSTDINKQPALKHSTGQWRACYPILAVEFCEAMAFFTISTNLVTFLTTVLHESKVSAARNMSAWVGACFLNPLVGAFVADTYLGRYWTVVVSLPVYIVGMLILILSAASTTNHGGPSIPGAVVYLGLYLAALGSGGIKPCTSSFGADQFDVNDPVELANKGSFFNWYYFLVTFSMLLSSTVIVWVQDNVGWAVSYAIPVVPMVLCLAVFVARSRVFRFREMGVSPLASISQVVVAAARNWKVQLPDDDAELHSSSPSGAGTSDTHLLKHTNQFRFFDRAALVAAEPSSARRPCTVTQVEELKMLLRMGSTWASFIVFFAVTAQMSSTMVEQGMLMDNRIGQFAVPPASVSVFSVVSTLALVPVYEAVLVPLARRFSGKRKGFSQLQRLGVGLALSTLAMAYAALLETRRLALVGTVSILWQAPVYLLLGGAHVFTTIGMAEFFYDQAPDTMKSLCAALAQLAVASGSYFNSLLLGIVAVATTRDGAPGWIPDNLNEGHLDYFFWTMAALSLFNLAQFVHRSMRSDPQAGGTT